MNGVPALVLLDSGTTRSFVSLALGNIFGDTPGELDYPLKLEITDDRPMQVSRVHRGCVLELFGERYLVYLVHVPLRGAR